MRRTLLTLLAVIAVVAGLVAVAAGGSSTITRARLERALPATFANIYTNQAGLLGHHGITPASLHAKAMCDKHGPDVADVGPGGDWVCLMSWTDPNVPMPGEGYGKFELNVHSNNCFTALGQTKLTGFLTLIDTHGREVTNPAFEFDGCFDPNGDNTPTGVEFPSVFNITTPAVTPAADGSVVIKASCGTGSQGCAGTVVATVGGATLGTVRFRAKEESTASLTFTGPLPAGTTEIDLAITSDVGVAGSSSSTVKIQSR